MNPQAQCHDVELQSNSQAVADQLHNDVPVRVKVLIQKITRWLCEHPHELSATHKGRVIIHFAGTDIVPQVEHIHEKL